MRGFLGIDDTFRTVIIKCGGGMPPALHFTSYSALILITSRPLYVPQALHTLCERRRAPHFEHFTRLGVSSFQCEERRLSLLAFDVFLFGTAMVTPPVNHFPGAVQGQRAWGLAPFCIRTAPRLNRRRIFHKGLCSLSCIKSSDPC